MVWGIFGRFLGIHNAARMGNIARVKELLRKNPSLVDARDESGNTPLHCAIGYFELGVFEELLAHNADVNAQDSNGVTPLHILAAGVPPDPPPPPKSVKLTTAGLQGIHLKMAELLLAHNADLHARTAWGWTPLETAEKSNTVHMVEFLRRRKTE
jgi:ankyrin repeat protein